MITVENTSDEDLDGVVLTDETRSGTQIESLVWTLPNGETLDAQAGDGGILTAAWNGPWAPGEVITGLATLTLQVGGELHSNVVSVTAEGAASGIPVNGEDPYHALPVERTYAVGDYVWIDANADGVQDEDEEPLEGVTVVLYDGEGNELDRTTTDEFGRYIFDELPAGEYQVQFILTDEQAELYEFTSYTSGGQSGLDSNAGERGYSAVFTLGPDNAFLVTDGEYEFASVRATEGIDPTWDAGVVLLEVDEPTTPPTRPGPTPEPSESPEPSEEPVPTESPEPSEEPVASEEPTPAESQPVESPAPSETPAVSDSPEPEPSEEAVSTDDPEPSGSTKPVGPAAGEGTGTDDGGSRLAVTGASIGGVALLALLLVGGGLALAVRSRRGELTQD